MDIFIACYVTRIWNQRIRVEEELSSCEGLKEIGFRFSHKISHVCVSPSLRGRRALSPVITRLLHRERNNEGLRVHASNGKQGRIVLCVFSTQLFQR